MWEVRVHEHVMYSGFWHSIETGTLVIDSSYITGTLVIDSSYITELYWWSKKISKLRYHTWLIGLWGYISNLVSTRQEAWYINFIYIAMLDVSFYFFFGKYILSVII